MIYSCSFYKSLQTVVNDYCFAQPLFFHPRQFFHNRWLLMAIIEAANGMMAKKWHLLAASKDFYEVKGAEKGTDVVF